jgi:AraC-like DNA-binding protein
MINSPVNLTLRSISPVKAHPMIRYSYYLKDFRSWLQGFSSVLRLPLSGGRIDIPSSMGEGYLRATNINSGISFVIMDFSLIDDLVLVRNKTTDGGFCLFFNQVTVSNFFSIREPHNSITDKTPQRSNIFLSSTNYELEVTYSRNSRLKRVGIFFGPSFVSHCMNKDLLRDLRLYTDNRLRNINREPISFEYRQLLDEIFTCDTASALGHLLLHNRILQLTEKFLQSFVTNALLPQPAPGPRTKGKEKDLEALKEVERILTDTKLNIFPSIDKLSRTAMMSSTKLKARFKQIYGMKLYEYYNRHRLAQAKDLLKTGNFSVKQVGTTIGFSNLSNFAKAFKKEFGILPKEMLKSK